MQAGIFNPFTPIPKNEKSHVRGWAKAWGCRLNAEILCKDDDISKYDILYLDHGVNFEGSLNLFGGLNSEVYERLDALHTFMKHGPLVSLDFNMRDINYLAQMEKRLGANSTDKRITPKFLKALAKQRIFECETQTHHDLISSSAIIGDSHSTAYASKSDKIFRTNGKTLYSVVKMGIDEYIKQFNLKSVRRLTFCLGSIDIRFHAHRHPSDFEALIIEYCEQLIRLNYDVQVCLPLPIESEDRKIPKSGFYKGQPFYGSRDERMAYLSLMKEVFEYFDLQIIHPSVEWYKLDPKKFESDYMEFGGSVHLSPLKYRMFAGEEWCSR